MNVENNQMVEAIEIADAIVAIDSAKLADPVAVAKQDVEVIGFVQDKELDEEVAQ